VEWKIGRPGAFHRLDPAVFHVRSLFAKNQVADCRGPELTESFRSKAAEETAVARKIFPVDMAPYYASVEARMKRVGITTVADLDPVEHEALFRNDPI
jgi:hypothetical protein